MAAADTRSRLLDATIAALDAGGEAAVSVDDIAKAAGVTAPTIYNHFRNREGLVAEAQAERFDREVTKDFDTLASIIDTIETREQFAAIVEATVAAFASPDRVALRMSRISAVGSAVGRPALAQQVDERFAALCTRFAEVIRPLQERGIVRADLDLFTFCAWFVGAITGRLFIEFGASLADPVAWNGFMRDAVIALTIAPETD